MNTEEGNCLSTRRPSFGLHICIEILQPYQIGEKYTVHADMLNLGKVNILGRHVQFVVGGFWTSQARLQLLHVELRYVRELFSLAGRPSPEHIYQDSSVEGLRALGHSCAGSDLPPGFNPAGHRGGQGIGAPLMLGTVLIMLRFSFCPAVTFPPWPKCQLSFA